MGSLSHVHMQGHGNFCLYLVGLSVCKQDAFACTAIPQCLENTLLPCNMGI